MLSVSISKLLLVSTRVSSIQTKKFRFEPKQTETRSFSVCFMKSKTNNFDLFRCFEPISKHPKQTETTLNFLKKKYALYQNVSVGRLFASVQSKHRYSLIRFRNKAKETEKNGKTLNFLKKYQNMLPIKLFRLVFCLFRFN